MIGPLLILLATIGESLTPHPPFEPSWNRMNTKFGAAITFTYLGLTVQYSLNASGAQNNLLLQNVFVSRLALSLATNVVATLLIGYQLWCGIVHSGL